MRGVTAASGDEVTCMVDVDNGIVRFYKNGIDQGIAYENESAIRGKTIVPAVCLGSNEGGKPVTISLIQPPSIEELATLDSMPAAAAPVSEWSSEDKRSTIYLSGSVNGLTAECIISCCCRW